MTLSRATAIAGSAVVTFASCRMRIVRGDIVNRPEMAVAGIDCHDKNDIAEMEDVFHQLSRARQVEHHTCLLAEVADLREDTAEMDCRRRLGLDEEMIGSGLGKSAR